MDVESKFPEWKRQNHEYYAELCALCTSGSLTEAEQAELNAHLRQCSSCSQLVLSYRAVVRTTATLLAPLAPAKASTPSKPWSVENAKKQLLNRIAADRAAQQPHLVPQSLPVPRKMPRMFVPVAAALVLAALLAGVAFQWGEIRGRRIAIHASESGPTETQPAGQIEALSRERAELDARLEAQNREVQRLERELQLQSEVIAESKASQSRLENTANQQNAAIAALGSDKNVLTAERDAVARKLQEAQDALKATEQRLDALQGEHNRQLLRVASLQARVDELSSTLKESEESVQRAERFLASDRDIRDLMGARDLYIADVFDIDREGKTQKAFGRVFYTGGKSLIFYAFDLDRQPGVREASTFQAWGRRGPEDKHPLSMGVLSMDNAANRRWVLRFDDPRVLNEIDAVFVTVEPRGGGRKPTGRQLLFASLRTPANHP
jgi:Anti-sigma-K factor rskA